jgi:hypothetical protein
MKGEKVVFFTIADDKYYYPVGTHILVNSFKRFHPDIDLVVFRQDMIDKVFAEHEINFYMAKPTFAKLLTPYYDLVVNIDADTVITGVLDEVFKDDYEVGAAWNYNGYENASFQNITEKMYVQAGLVGSRNKRFWDIWEEANKDAMKYMRQENDILNLVWYNNPEVKKMKRKIYDKKKDYYGCKSLGKESKFYVEDRVLQLGDRGSKTVTKALMCDGEVVRAYHHAKGAGALPKLQFNQMGFNKDVVDFLNIVGYWGKSERYGSI